MLGRNEGFTTDKKGRRVDIDRQTEASRVGERARHVRCFEETVVNANTEEPRRSGPSDRRLVGALQEEVERHGLIANTILVGASAKTPGFHEYVDSRRDQKRQPAALNDLKCVRRQEHEVDKREQAEERIN